MSFLTKRKVNINFLGVDFVKITNMFYTKEHNLTENCSINLFTCQIVAKGEDSLKKAKTRNCPFFIYLSKKPTEKAYVGVVYFKQSKDDLSILQPEISREDNNDTVYSASIWEDD